MVKITEIEIDFFNIYQILLQMLPQFIPIDSQRNNIFETCFSTHLDFKHFTEKEITVLESKEQKEIKLFESYQ